MSVKAAITVMRPRSEVERLWHESEAGGSAGDGLTVRFVDAPGDRGTEIHVELSAPGPLAALSGPAQKLLGKPPLAKVKDRLRHFKQLTETGVIACSEASPEGESMERKFHERPAQPMDPAERQEVLS